jgi:hypothetical protein
MIQSDYFFYLILCDVLFIDRLYFQTRILKIYVYHSYSHRCHIIACDESNSIELIKVHPS